MVRLRDCAGVPAVPPAGLVRRTYHRADLRDDALSRGRPVQDQLRQPTRRFFRSCRIESGSSSFSSLPSSVVPLFRQRLHHQRGNDTRSCIFSLAAIGLNLLTGYTGLLSLGTGAFMGVGAYACYKLTTLFPKREHHHLDRSRPASSLPLSALCSACRRLRIKGFYLAIATLAAQFFLAWCFIRHAVALQLQCIRRRSKCRSAHSSAF